MLISILSILSILAYRDEANNKLRPKIKLFLVSLILRGF